MLYLIVTNLRKSSTWSPLGNPWVYNKIMFCINKSFFLDFLKSFDFRTLLLIFKNWNHFYPSFYSFRLLLGVVTSFAIIIFKSTIFIIFETSAIQDLFGHNCSSFSQFENEWILSYSLYYEISKWVIIPLLQVLLKILIIIKRLLDLFA